MDFKINDEILVSLDYSDPTSITRRKVTKVGKDTIQCGSSENTFYKAFCWPLSCENELKEILNKRAELKKIYEDSITLIYLFSNKVRN